MKKLIASLAIAAALFSVGSAYAADDSRWEKVGQSAQSNLIFYVDNSSLEYAPASDSSKAWVKEQRMDSSVYALFRYQINYKNKTYYEGAVATVYTPSGIQKQRNPSSGYQQIMPDTMAERIADYVAANVSRDEKLAAYEKEQNDKKADAEREKTMKKGVNLLRGAFGL